MKFLITGDIHSKRGLFWAVLFFILFSWFFWFSNILNFYVKYGFSYDSIYKYYFTDLEFPEIISVQQLAEDLHINLFILSFFFIMVASLYNLSNARFKVYTIISAGIFTALYTFSDFLALAGIKLVVYTKSITFFIFQGIYAYMLLVITFHILLKKPPGKRIVPNKIAVYIGMFLIGLFVFSTVLIYFSKYGIGINGVKEYFFGNPEKYKKPKTITGVFKYFYPHIISMAVLAFSLVHFSLFKTQNKRLIAVAGGILFISLFIENLSSVLILVGGEIFVYLKVVTFYVSMLFIAFFMAMFLLKR